MKTASQTHTHTEQSAAAVRLRMYNTKLLRVRAGDRWLKHVSTCSLMSTYTIHQPMTHCAAQIPLGMGWKLQFIGIGMEYGQSSADGGLLSLGMRCHTNNNEPYAYPLKQTTKIQFDEYINSQSFKLTGLCHQSSLISSSIATNRCLPSYRSFLVALNLTQTPFCVENFSLLLFM